MFWETAICEDGGPDVDILSRKVTVQSGVPDEEITEWTYDSEYLAEVLDTARAISQSLSMDGDLFKKLSRRMKEDDPNWTWQAGVAVHHGNVPGPPPARRKLLRQCW